MQYIQRPKMAPVTRNGWRPSYSVWSGTISRRRPCAVIATIFAIHDLAEHDLIAYRQHMVAAGRRPTFPPTLTSYATLRAIRYRALLHGWAFRPY